MTIGVLQETAVDNALTAQTTISATLTGVAAGSAIHAIVLTNHNYGISGVVDSANGALAAQGSPADDATSSRKVLQYLISGVSAGSHTVTATMSFSVNAPGTLVLREIGSTTGFDATANGNVQAAPTTATDAVTSQAATNTASPALISALSFNTNGASPATGTGFTAGQSTSVPSLSGNFRTESKRVTSSASQAATFTAAVSNTHLTVMLILDESSSFVPPPGKRTQRIHDTVYSFE